MRINRTHYTPLRTCVVTIVLLLGAGATEAATVIFDLDNPGQAIGITDLMVLGNPYDVSFTERTTAAQVYGPFPGTGSPGFDFTNIVSAAIAMDAVNLQLTLNGGVLTVGAEDVDVSQPIFFIGFNAFELLTVETLIVWEGTTVSVPGNGWIRPFMLDIISYQVDQRVYADFTLVPEPSTALLLGLGLVGVGACSRRRS